MKVLGSAVLAMEAIVILLATSLAASMGSANPGLAWGLGGVLIVLLVLATRTMGRPSGVIVGWVLQGLVLATAIVVPAMWVVGGVFAVLWFFAVRNGRRVDAMRAAAPPPAEASQ